jgi:copper oxidase (laccase) domain-containing protein
MVKYSKLNYLIDEEVAFFPRLTGIKHGFSWGRKSENMSYSFGENTGEVHSRIIKFLSHVGMSPIEKSVTMYAEHSDGIFILTKENLATLKIKESFKNSGYDATCDAILTTEPGITLIAKPGDCAISIIQAVSRSGVKIAGLVHTGTKGMLKRLASKTILMLQTDFDCDAKDIKVGITPSIRPESYFAHDRSKFGDLNLDEWQDLVEIKEGKFHIDILGSLIKEYIQAGITDENIFAYDIDTFESSKAKEGFSHSYSFNNNENHGRFIVAVEL